jgi:hypothetical protein
MVARWSPQPLLLTQITMVSEGSHTFIRPVRILSWDVCGCFRDVVVVRAHVFPHFVHPNSLSTMCNRRVCGVLEHTSVTLSQSGGTVMNLLRTLVGRDHYMTW